MKWVHPLEGAHGGLTHDVGQVKHCDEWRVLGTKLGHSKYSITLAIII